MNLREKSVVAYEKMSTEKCDGLIIVCKQHPTAILMYLSKVSIYLITFVDRVKMFRHIVQCLA